MVFLDACVLFPPSLRDVVHGLAETGICQIRRSPAGLDEMHRNIVKQSPVELEPARSTCEVRWRALSLVP